MSLMLNSSCIQTCESCESAKIFLVFLKAYDSKQVHNMFAIKLHPWFKHLCAVKKYVGCMNTIHLVIEYDAKEIIPFLSLAFID